MLDEETEFWYQKLKEALAVSEYHFKDVIDDMVQRMRGSYDEEDF